MSESPVPTAATHGVHCTVGDNIPQVVVNLLQKLLWGRFRRITTCTARFRRQFLFPVGNGTIDRSDLRVTAWTHMMLMKPSRLERITQLWSFSKGSQTYLFPILTWLVVISSACYSLAWPASSVQIDLNSQVKALLNDACFHKGRTGLRAVDVKSGLSILDLNGEALLIPASTTKLMTSAAALLRLGPQYRFRTALLTTGGLQEGMVQGDLFVKGYGDPGLVLEEVWLMARGIRQRGIRGIQGDLVADESFFDDEQRGPGWADARSQRAFNAKVGALSVHFNSATLMVRPGAQPGDAIEVDVDPPSRFIHIRNLARTAPQGRGQGLTITRLEGEAADTLVIEGSLAAGDRGQVVHRNLSHPALHAIMVVRELLEREGIRLMGGVRLGQAPPEAREVYVHQSRALYRLIDDLNKFSSNFMAEQVIKSLGAEVYGPPGSWAKGLAVVAEVLAVAGIPRGTYTLVDGSGLSRLNRLSAAQLVRVLLHMARDFRVQPEYTASLRTPDADGRQSGRFRGAHFAQQARVKTGSLDDVSALAGYVGRMDGTLLAFAVLMNGPFCAMERAWQLQDTIVEMLMQSG